MYLWKIEKLKQVLVKRPLSQDEALKYLIYFFVAYRLFGLWGKTSSVSTTWPAWVSLLGLCTIIFEVFACYKFNGGKNGDDFLGRYFSIRLLTSIRLFIFFVLISSLFLVPACWQFDSDIGQCFAANPLYMTVFKISIFAFYSVLTPLRVIMHMRSLNQSEIK